MDYSRGNHSKYLISYHIILVTKYRHPILNHINIKDIFKRVEKESNFTIIEMEANIDHVHFLIKCLPKYSVSSIIRRLKTRSTMYCWKYYFKILSHYYWKRKCCGREDTSYVR